jgi:hypothetical protein
VKVLGREAVGESFALRISLVGTEKENGSMYFDVDLPDAYCGGGASTVSGALRSAFESLVRRFTEEPGSELELITQLRSRRKDLER